MNLSKCEVKDCENENPEYVHISHEDGDKSICAECLSFYYPERDIEEWDSNPTDYIRRIPATKTVLAIVLGMSILIPYGLLLLI